MEHYISWDLLVSTQIRLLVIDMKDSRRGENYVLSKPYTEMFMFFVCREKKSRKKLIFWPATKFISLFVVVVWNPTSAKIALQAQQHGLSVCVRDMREEI